MFQGRISTGQKKSLRFPSRDSHPRGFALGDLAVTRAALLQSFHLTVSSTIQYTFEDFYIHVVIPNNHIKIIKRYIELLKRRLTEGVAKWFLTYPLCWPHGPRNSTPGEQESDRVKSPEIADSQLVDWPHLLGRTST